MDFGLRENLRADEMLTAFLELESAIFKDVSERCVDHIETMDGPEILNSVDRIDKLDKIGRRNFGLDDSQAQDQQPFVNVAILDPLEVDGKGSAISQCRCFAASCAMKS